MTSTQSLITMLSELVNVKDLMYNREVEFKYNNRDIRIHYFSTMLEITDVTNAKKRSKTCVQINVYTDNNEDIDACKYMNETNIATLETFFEKFETYEIGYFLNDIRHKGYVYTVNNMPSTEIIPAQCNLKNIYKPVHELKLKNKHAIRINDIIRLLINNNVQVVQDGRYTDDYAWDAETNFNKGHMFNPIEFAKQLIKYNGGWSAYIDMENKKRIHINCYSFDCRSIYLDTPIQTV